MSSGGVLRLFFEAERDLAIPDFTDVYEVSRDMKKKMTFTIPEEVVDRLKEMVVHSQRSAFVASALEQRLRGLEEERLSKELIEGYIERYEEDNAIDEEWDVTTSEGWP